MNKTAKVGTRSKPVKKASSALSSAVKPAKKRSKMLLPASKPVKKRVKALSSAKAVVDDDGWKPEVVPLAEVEVLAAKAVRMIKAKRSVSAAVKARKLALVEEKLERARGWGGLSKSGAWGLKHPFGLDFTYIDWEAVLR
jgi:hypothetical protein